MTKLDDIEKAVAQLAPGEFDRFRVWFEELQAMRFDQKIERDAVTGKLDSLADAAQSAFRKGHAREL